METNNLSPELDDIDVRKNETVRIGGTVVKTLVIPYDGTERQYIDVFVPSPNRFMRDLPA